MLNLASETSPLWTQWAVDHLDDILVDHAHCEKKAAGAAIRLLFQYPQHAFLQHPLSRLAREELGHFEQLLNLLAERGIEFRRQRPSPYGGRLKQLVRTDEPERLLDLLLCCALIEARSCERMKCLGDATEDSELADFYRGLHAAEARHHGLYVGLARELADAEIVNARLAELAQHEAAILAEPSNLCRMHT
jgi:tRNA-(ms[2]io[6]A)-hydroxylase